jgi:hypothetical protein
MSIMPSSSQTQGEAAILIYHRFVTNPSFIAHVEIHDVTP